MNAANALGADGRSDANFPAKARQRPEESHAIDAIVDLVMANSGEMTILAQAPLTNIAAADVKEPRIAKAVRHLWIYRWHGPRLGNATPAAEFNF